jgi:hypothetical protein
VRRAASKARTYRGIVRTVITPAQDTPLERPQRLGLHGTSRLWPRQSGKHDDSADHVGTAPKAPSDLVVAQAGVRQSKNPALESS